MALSQEQVAVMQQQGFYFNLNYKGITFEEFSNVNLFANVARVSIYNKNFEKHQVHFWFEKGLHRQRPDIQKPAVYSPMSFFYSPPADYYPDFKYNSGDKAHEFLEKKGWVRQGHSSKAERPGDLSLEEVLETAKFIQATFNWNINLNVEYVCVPASQILNTNLPAEKLVEISGSKAP